MAEKRFVKYGDKEMELPDGMTLEAAKKEMSRFFPELSDPKVESKKEKRGTVYTFSKKAGTKGAEEIQPWSPVAINAYRQGFMMAAEFARETGWSETHYAGAISLLDTILQVATTGQKVGFFDVIRNDPNLSEEDRAYWLALESKADEQR